MNDQTKAVLHTTGLMFLICAAVMVVPVLFCIYWNSWACFRGFLLSMGICLALGLTLVVSFRKKVSYLNLKASILTLLAAWGAVCVSTSFPYLFSNAHANLVDALFESVSALTTTGATAFASTAFLPRPLIFWRSCCQWLGGAGVLVMLSSLLRRMGGSGNLLKLENPGFVLSENEARYTELAKRLLASYCAISLLQILILILGGVSPFDSFVLTLSTVSTGGATYYGDSVVHFGSVFVETVVAVFMVLASLNLSLGASLFRGDFRRIGRDSELKAFGIILFFCGTAVSLDLFFSGTDQSFLQALRYGWFHTISFITTSGMYSCDCSSWPVFSRSLLTMLSFVGGCSMSTTGGLKIFRLILLLRLVRRSFTMRLHPAAVEAVRINGRQVSNTMLTSLIAFSFTHLAMLLGGIFILSFEAPDLQTSFTASAALLNNIGAGFGAMGLGGCYAAYSPLMKLFMVFLMLCGRLELYAVLLPFTPEFRKEQ